MILSFYLFCFFFWNKENFFSCSWGTSSFFVEDTALLTFVHVSAFCKTFSFRFLFLGSKMLKPDRLCFSCKCWHSVLLTCCLSFCFFTSLWKAEYNVYLLVLVMYFCNERVNKWKYIFATFFVCTFSVQLEEKTVIQNVTTRPFVCCFFKYLNLWRKLHWTICMSLFFFLKGKILSLGRHGVVSVDQSQKLIPSPPVHSNASFEEDWSFCIVEAENGFWNFRRPAAFSNLHETV